MVGVVELIVLVVVRAK